MKERIVSVFLLLVGMSPAGSSDSFLLNGTDRVTGQLGHSVVLPCWLSPAQDVDVMEVRWYRPDQFSTPVLLYRNRKLVLDQQDEAYINRSSLSLRRMGSSGLREGDVSLRLDKLKLQDAGDFNCYVSGDKNYQSRPLTLTLIAIGSSPLFSLQLVDDLVNVSCTSCGWLPDPAVKWTSNLRDTIRARGVEYRSWEKGLRCVHTWVLVSPSGSNQVVSCSLSISEEHKRDGAVDIGSIAQLTEGGGSGAWIAFSIVALIAIALAVLSGFFYKKYKAGYVLANKDEEQQLTACRKTNIDDLKKFAEEITINDLNASPHLTINKTGKIVRDSGNVAQSSCNPGFPYYLSVIGREGYGRGRSYWEVGLKKNNVPVKRSWLIGVTQGICSYSLNNKSTLTPSQGFWFLYSDEKGIYANTEPEILLPVAARPESVGVFLNYEQEELSFYDATEGLHLVTMKVKFQGNVYPLFNPGIGDESPLEIKDIQPPRSKRSDEPAEGANAQNDVEANVE